MNINESINTLISADKSGVFTLGLYSPGIGNAPEIDYPVQTERSSGVGEDDRISHSSRSRFVTGYLIDRLKEIKSVFNDDGSFNPKSKIAESYAITLALEKKYSGSKILFDMITASGIEDLIINPESRKNGFEVLPVKDKLGALGFEGVLQYANACRKIGDTDKAKDLYMLIANVPKNYCGAIRFGDVRVEAISTLVHDYNCKDLRSLYEWAKREQY